MTIHWDGRRWTRMALPDPPQAQDGASLNGVLAISHDDVWASGEIALPGTPVDRKYFEFFLEGTEPAALRDDPWKIPRWGVFTAKP